MARHREEEHDKENSERWLLTYADLITLLMAFFMVLYAMSQMDLKRFKKLGGSLSAAFHTTSGGGVLGAATGKVLGTGSGSVEPEFQRVAAEIEKYRTTQNIRAAVRITFDERGMVIRLDENLLFPPGSASLTPPAKRVLDRLAEILRRQPNHLRIEGHTDDTPIHTDRYPSNWQLSTDRATNVIVYWVGRGTLPPERLSAAGYGQYRPVVPNDTPAHRALNRRVEVVLLRQSLTKYEPWDRSAERSGEDEGAGSAGNG